MASLQLVAAHRDRTLTARDLRLTRNIPAIVYGRDFPSTPVQIDMSTFIKTFRASHYTHIITLDIAGAPCDVLVHEVQRHPVSDDIIHIDFRAVSKNEKIAVYIPVQTSGISPAVQAGFALAQHLTTLHVKCLPGDLIDSFIVPVDELKDFGDSVYVRDMGIDLSKYELLTNPEENVVSIINTNESSATK
jgi:large subunit ribosomal protein L25